MSNFSWGRFEEFFTGIFMPIRKASFSGRRRPNTVWGPSARRAGSQRCKQRCNFSNFTSGIAQIIGRRPPRSRKEKRADHHEEIVSSSLDVTRQITTMQAPYLAKRAREGCKAIRGMMR